MCKPQLRSWHCSFQANVFGSQDLIENSLRTYLAPGGRHKKKETSSKRRRRGAGKARLMCGLKGFTSVNFVIRCKFRSVKGRAVDHEFSSSAGCRNRKDFTMMRCISKADLRPSVASMAVWKTGSHPIFPVRQNGRFPCFLKKAEHYSSLYFLTL
jgi:hypothetical protein